MFDELHKILNNPSDISTNPKLEKLSGRTLSRYVSKEGTAQETSIL